MHLEELCRLRELAKASKQYGPAIQAEIERGEAGFYVKRRENIRLPLSQAELVARIQEVLARSGLRVVAQSNDAASGIIGYVADESRR